MFFTKEEFIILVKFSYFWFNFCGNFGRCPNLPVTFVGGDIKYYADSKVLNSTEWIKIVDAELQPLDLLYPMRVSIRVEFLDENN